MSRNASRVKPVRVKGTVYLPEPFDAVRVADTTYWYPGNDEVRVAEGCLAETFVAK
jgi:hypothetical protein